MKRRNFLTSLIAAPFIAKAAIKTPLITLPDGTKIWTTGDSMIRGGSSAPLLATGHGGSSFFPTSDAKQWNSKTDELDTL